MNWKKQEEDMLSAGSTYEDHVLLSENLLITSLLPLLLPHDCVTSFLRVISPGLEKTINPIKTQKEGGKKKEKGEI